MNICEKVCVYFFNYNVREKRQRSTGIYILYDAYPRANILIKCYSDYYSGIPIYGACVAQSRVASCLNFEGGRVAVAQRSNTFSKSKLFTSGILGIKNFEDLSNQFGWQGKYLFKVLKAA